MIIDEKGDIWLSVLKVYLLNMVLVKKKFSRIQYIFSIFIATVILSLCITTYSSIIPDNKVIIVANRGVLDMAPENTMAAFKMAVELGANGIMVDLRRTKDKRLVLMNDEVIDRTTDGMGRIDMMLYDELRLYDAGSWWGDEFKGEKVPLLSDVLLFCKLNGLKLILDVKHFGVERQLITLVKEYDMIEHVYFWGILRNIRELEPSLPIYNLLFAKANEIERDTVEFAHAERNHVCIKMLNSDNRAVIKKGISKKADVIITNFPQLIMDIFHAEDPGEVNIPGPSASIDGQVLNANLADEGEIADLTLNGTSDRGETLYVRDELSSLLRIIQSKEVNDDDARMVALAASSAVEKSVVPLLIELLDHKKAKVRRNAAWALGLRMDLDGMQPLLDTLKDKDEIVRRESILGIKRILTVSMPDKKGQKLIIKALLKVLRNDKSPEVRYDAARTLGDFRDIDTIGPLVKVLEKDTDWMVKSACAGSLGLIGNENAVKSLGTILISDHNLDAAWARKRAAWALADIGAPSVNSLVGALRDNEKNVRQRAYWALVKIGKPSVQALVSMLKDTNKEIRIMSASALGWINDEFAINALKWTLKDSVPSVRMSAVWALGRTGSIKVIEPLRKLRKDKNFRVRMSVTEAISRIRDREDAKDEK